MSVKWDSPTQKGTEILVGTAAGPAKVVVKGPRELVAAHQHMLSQFVAKQRQAYSLSTVGVQRGMIDRDGARAIYTNIQGQEYVELQVRTTQSSKKHLVKRPKTYRDMLLITFKYPEMWGRTATHSAYLRSPLLTPLPAHATAPVRGTAFETVRPQNDGSDHPVLSFPPLSPMPLYEPPFATRAAIGNHYSTLLIDLRPILGLPAYTIDIYCQLLGEASRSCDLTLWSLDPDAPGGPGTVTELVPGYESFYSLSSATGGDITHPIDWFVPIESYYEDWYNKGEELGGIGSFVFDPPVSLDDVMPANDPRIPTGWDGIQTAHKDDYYRVSFGSVDFAVPSGSGAIGHYDHLGIEHATTDLISTWNPVHGWTLTYDYEQDAEVFGTFLSPADNLGIALNTGEQSYPGGLCGDYTLNQSFSTWELEDHYPDRPAHIRLGTARATSAVQGGPFTFANHLNQTKLCTITYDREHDALSMKPA